MAAMDPLYFPILCSDEQDIILGEAVSEASRKEEYSANKEYDKSSGKEEQWKRKSSGTKVTRVIISGGSWMSGIGALVPAFSNVTLKQRLPIIGLNPKMEQTK